MTEFKWKRASRNKIVAWSGDAPKLLIQLTRYKTNRREPKGTWKLRVLTKPFEYGRKMYEHLSVPIPVTAPSEAMEAAEAYIHTVQGLKEGPLSRINEMRFGTVDEWRFIKTKLVDSDELAEEMKKQEDERIRQEFVNLDGGPSL